MWYQTISCWMHHSPVNLSQNICRNGDTNFCTSLDWIKIISIYMQKEYIHVVRWYSWYRKLQLLWRSELAIIEGPPMRWEMRWLTWNGKVIGENLILHASKWLVGCARNDSHICLHTAAVVAEWLRRWTWNPMGIARTGSNPVNCDILCSWDDNATGNPIWVLTVLNASCQL